MIKPTVGRVVWYRPAEFDKIPHHMNRDPLAAIVVGVVTDSLVNLSVFDLYGKTHALQDVLLVQPEDDLAPVDGYAEWMPFQKGQAAKADAVVPSSRARELAVARIGLDGYGDVEMYLSAVDSLARYIESGALPVKQEAKAEAKADRQMYAHEIVRCALAAETVQGIGDGARERAADVPRVTSDQIEALKERVTYSVEERPLGSTSTLVHAFLDGTFYLATGHSACVSAEAFNAERGLQIALENVKRAAEDALWKYEGYALMKRLQEPATVVITGDSVTINGNVRFEGDLLGEDGPLQAVGV
jgi:hypothetical protein